MQINKKKLNYNNIISSNLLLTIFWQSQITDVFIEHKMQFP